MTGGTSGVKCPCRVNCHLIRSQCVQYDFYQSTAGAVKTPRFSVDTSSDTSAFKC